MKTKAGVTDPYYTGSIKVILFNFGPTAIFVQKGDRVAPVILETYSSANIHEQNLISQANRGANGFGSTDPPQHKPTPTSSSANKLT